MDTSNLISIVEAANSSERISGLTHVYYNYPARFSPGLAREIIEQFSNRGDLVLDPFVGGGTTLIEAKLTGRHSIGFDISTLSTFLSNAKLNPIKQDRFNYFETWFNQLVSDLNLRKHVPRPHEWISKGYQKHLSYPKTWQIRKLIEQYLFELERTNADDSEKDFLRCVLLKTAQWALDSKKNIPNTRLFKEKLFENFSKMLEGANDFWNQISDVSSIAVNSAADKIHHHKSLFIKSPKLIVTSPPYPGIHVVYHRWQIFGSKETPAPFWIANSLDGHGLSHYAMGSRNQEGLKGYFENILKSFASIRQICDNETMVVQVLAFSQIDWQLPKYLETMEDAGFKEILSDDRIWREVPNRKWYAQQKGKTSSSQEVILFHRSSS